MMSFRFGWARLSILAVLLLAASPAVRRASAADTPSGPALYKRLGGYDAIAAVTDDFLGRLLAEPRLAKFFTGASHDSKGRIRQHIVDQLCLATGGPCIYTGRTMKAAHAGLGISEDDWNAAVADLVASLDKFRVPAREKGELAAILATVKGDIVEK
jgi:hemoglobin